MEPKLIAIAACDRLGVIGKAGQMPWRYEEEMAHFYQTIANYPIIMGYKTYISLPAKIFKDRVSFVMTKNHYISRPGIFMVRNLLTLKRFYRNSPDLCQKPSFVIGGGAIFNLFLQGKLVNSAIITHIHEEHAGDTFFPLDALKNASSQLIKKTDQFSIIQYNIGASS